MKCSIVAAAGAGPWPHSTFGTGSSAVATIAGTSPPGPFRCGSTTCSTNPAATAASNAFPPSSSIRIADCDASQCVDEAIPNVPRNVGLVVNPASSIIRQSRPGVSWFVRQAMRFCSAAITRWALEPRSSRSTSASHASGSRTSDGSRVSASSTGASVATATTFGATSR